MNIYMAAVYTNGYRAGGNSGRYAKLTDHEKRIVDALPHLLESYHYIGKQKFVDAIKEDGVTVFLDSGAFSAFTLGVELRVSDCDYILRNIDIIRKEDDVLIASVLDGIGDALQTWRNQIEMEQRGVRPLPCFHAGEDERYLEWYVARYPYITLGGMVGTSSKQLCVWLDRIWDKYLLDGSGRARLKVHGFGITAIPIMERYPWHSCDSSSWVQSAAFGGIVTPQHGPLSVSEESPNRHVAGQHVMSLTSIEQEYVLQMLEKAGFTYERLSKVYEARAAYNLWAYGVINTMINASRSEKFRIQTQDLFGAC